MSAASERQLDDDVPLLRRSGAEKIDVRSSAVKPGPFNLRTTRGERELSFYDANQTTCERVLLGVPIGAGGWDVAVISAGALRSLGFEVCFAPDAEDAVNGLAHVAARPPELDDEGQIPLVLRARMAALARWEVEPDPSRR